MKGRAMEVEVRTVTVLHVNIPAMSTIGYGEGFDAEGRVVSFVGDHRPMRYIGEAIAQAQSEDDLPRVDLEDWQIA